MAVATAPSQFLRMERPFTANLAAFLDQTLDAVLASNDQRQFVYANEAAVHLFGEDRQSILAHRIEDVMEAPPGLTIADLWTLFMNDGKFRGRVTLRRKDGGRRDIEITATANWRPGIHVGFCRDFTDRALAERRLATQFEIAQALSDATSIADAAPRLLGALAFTLDAGAGALWITDRQADVLRCAGAWVGGDQCAYLGSEAPTVALPRGTGIPGGVWMNGRMVWVEDLATASDSPRVESALACGMTSGCAFPIFGTYGVIGVAEFFGARIERPTQEHLDMMTAACGQLGHFAERRRAESQLLATGRLGWHMPLGLAVWRHERLGDDYAFRLVATNPALHSIVGGVDWTVGATMQEIIPHTTESPIPRRMADVARTGLPADMPEFESRLNPGMLFSFRIIPLPDQCVGVLVEDVTERRRVERSLLQYTGNLEAEINARIAQVRQLETERARAEKLAAAGRLAARVAHEIINPLASIKNAFALVKDGVREDFAHAHYVPRIEREIDRIARIVGQMRQLYRPITEPVAECDVVALVQDLIALSAPGAADRNVTLRLKASEWPLYAAVQQDGVREILQNLLRNALDVSPAGSAIDVTVAGRDKELEFVVADEGPGIPPESADHIFEPFYSTKGGGNGSAGLGLGLSIAQGLALAMRGHITVVPGRARGAAFRVVIPRDATRIPA